MKNVLIHLCGINDQTNQSLAWVGKNNIIFLCVSYVHDDDASDVHVGGGDDDVVGVGTVHVKRVDFGISRIGNTIGVS